MSLASFSHSSLEIDDNFFAEIIKERHSHRRGKSGVFTAAFNSLNTLVGSGLLLPYTMYQSGLILGSLTILLTILMGLYSTYLLIQWKNMTGHDSLASIGNYWYGRNYIYLVSGINLVLCIGIPIAYFIILSDAVTPIIRYHYPELHNMLEIRTMVVLTTGVLLFIFWVKRDLHDLRIISIISWFWAVIFCINLAASCFLTDPENEEPISSFISHRSTADYFKAAPNFIIAYCFQPSFLIVYRSLNNRSDNNAMLVTRWIFLLSTCFYILASTLSLVIYGSNIKSDLLLNITEDDENSTRYISSTLFLVIAASHIPVIFFVGKESLLTIYWEYRYSTLSEDRHLTRDNSSGEEHNFGGGCKNVNISSNLHWKEYYPLIVFLYLVVIILAIFIHDLGKILSFVGASWATVIGYIFPSVFFLKLQDGNAQIHIKVLAFIVLTFGTTFLVLGLYSNLFL